MKKKYFICAAGFLVIAIAVGISSLYKNDDNNVEGNTVAPATQLGTIKASLQTFNFDQAVSESDLIVKIEVKSKIKELDEPSAKTLFSADIKDTYKADGSLSSSSIKILQAGNSTWLYEGSRPFSENDQYVLFLKKAVGMEETDVYWILGEETGMYQDLRNGKLVKIALRDPELNDIEDEQLTQSLQEESNKELKTATEVQVVFESKFREKINQYLKAK